MKYHLAILAKGWSELILNGKKTIESRFSQNRCAPFGKVNKGDIVYLKESGGPVKGMFRAGEVETFEDLTPAMIEQIFVKYREQIFTINFPEMTLFPQSDEGCWTTYHPPFEWQVSKYATLIHITGVVQFEEPYPLPFRKRSRQAWVVLKHPLHVCEICHDPYLVEVFEGPDGELLHGSQHFCSPCYARECVSPDEELALAMEDS